MSTHTPAPGTPQTSTKAQLAALASAVLSLVLAFVVSWVAGNTGVNLNLEEILGALAASGVLGAAVGGLVHAVPNKPTS